TLHVDAVVGVAPTAATSAIDRDHTASPCGHLPAREDVNAVVGGTANRATTLAGDLHVPAARGDRRTTAQHVQPNIEVARTAGAGTEDGDHAAAAGGHLPARGDVDAVVRATGSGAAALAGNLHSTPVRGDG